MLIYLFFLIACLTLLIKNILILFFTILTIFIFLQLKIKEFNIKIFLDKLDKLSVFCITIIFSYILLGLIKQSNYLFFLYLKDATIITLKIIDIIFINFFIQYLNLSEKVKNKTINKIIKYFPELENILFQQLSLYPGKINKLKNIDKIIVSFIYQSIITIENK